MTPDKIIFVVTSLLSQSPDPANFPAVSAGGADKAFPVHAVACPRPLPPEEIEGKTVVCGRVSVPENHDKPDGRRIELTFAVLKAWTQSPAADPLIYLHGGPGIGTMADLSTIVAPLWNGYRNRRDVVTFDQRAAGISNDMVTCLHTAGGNIVDLISPSGKDAEEKFDRIMADCVKEIGQNAELPAYNTIQNAKDVRALMKTLGYGGYNIYGLSYGTKLALEVMRSAPDNVRSVILDSVAPPNAKFYDENILPVEEGVQAVVDQCAADAACAKAFPELDKTILRVAEKLRLNPIPAARGRDAVTLKTMIGLFENRNSAGNWPAATAHIPLILTEWDRGETKTWDFLSSGGTGRPQSVAEILRPHEAGLSAEQKALAAALLNGAMARRTQDAGDNAALQALSESLAKATQGEASLARRFDDAVTRSIASTRSREKMIGFAVAYAGLAAQTPDRSALKALVTDHLPAADIDGVLAIVAAMTDADIAAVFAAVAKEMRGALKALDMAIDLSLIACQEDMPYNSKAGADAFNNSIKFKFLTESSMAQSEIYGVCTMLPPSPIPGFHDPVTSDLPTLVLYGLNDTQTSTKDAKLAASTLKNARVLGFPEAGHGAIVFSQCAKDIGMAFVERPDVEPETACIETLRPKWKLPAN